MDLQLIDARFDSPAGHVSQTRTDSGNALSLLFDTLTLQSAAADRDATPQTRSCEGEVRTAGAGWVLVTVRGACVVVGAHGFAHLTGWANGRRLRAAGSSDEPWAASVVAPVLRGGLLRLSLLLLAQRDLSDTSAAAQLWVDSIDISVVEQPRRTA